MGNCLDYKRMRKQIQKQIQAEKDFESVPEISPKSLTSLKSNSSIKRSQSLSLEKYNQGEIFEIGQLSSDEEYESESIESLEYEHHSVLSNGRGVVH